MAKAVVDSLEAVKVDKQQGQARGVPIACLETLRKVVA